MYTEKLDLTGKVAVVTGAGRGLGRQMSIYLARAGADVVCAARSVDQIERTANEVRQEGRRALVVPTDATKSADCNAMVERALAEFGHIDIMVNNAGGGGGSKAIWEITDEEWRYGIDLNLSAAFYCSRAVVPHMAERKQGKIISLASGYGLRGGRDNYMYCSGKGGIVNFTRVLALSVVQDNVQVNAIAPGWFPHWDQIPEDRAQAFRARERFQITGRYGETWELGPLCVFLASAASDYMTGHTIVIDGGGMLAAYAPTGFVPTPA